MRTKEDEERERVIIDQVRQARARLPKFDMGARIEYWKKVKDTIHVFDKIVVQYVVQWSAVMLGMIGASALIYPSSGLIAGTVSLAAIVVSIPIGTKCYFYYQLLEEGLNVAIEMEKLIFVDGDDLADFKNFGLTYRLGLKSRSRHGEMTFYGLTIFLPFIILATSSMTLSFLYFQWIKTPVEAAALLIGSNLIPILAIIFGRMLFAKFSKGHVAQTDQTGVNPPQ